MLALLVAAAFLAGSIPFGLLIARAKGVDIRKHGSGNIGATNVGRVLGKPYFALCFALDLLKGLVPTVAMGLVLGALGRFTFSLDVAAWWLGAALASILGHVFCPWLGFRGGKGVATGLGALLGVFPLLSVAAGVATLTWIIVMYRWRYVSLASIVASLTLVPTIAVAWHLTQPAANPIANPVTSSVTGSVTGVSGHWLLIGVGAALTVLVIWTHRANIRRLRAGTELRATPRKST